MTRVQGKDLFDAGLFVIDENLEVETTQQIQVNLVRIVADGHHKRATLIKHADLPVK